MSQLQVARRYAQAFMDSSDDRKEQDRVADDLLLVQRLVRESKDFSVFLRSPAIPKEKKRSVLAVVFGKTIRPITLEFLDLLVEKRREDVLPQIIEQFFLLRDEKLGIVEVEVKATTDLSKDHMSKLEKRFEAYTGKKIRISFNQDQRLGGGFVARVGDTVFDGSVKRQLEILRERFLRGTDEQ